MIKQCQECKQDFNARRSTVRFCSVKCKDIARIIDLRKQKFGMLQVLDHPIIRRKSKTFFKCKCDCGNIKEIEGWNLRNGITTSCGCKNKLPKGESACRFIFGMYKRQGLSRGHKFELTLDMFKAITQQNCFYCGSKPSNVCDKSSSNANGSYIYNGIDRWDNNKGYVINNVVPCCKNCNSMKSKMHGKVFLDQIKKILDYRQKTATIKK